jgi:hypothetical protein
VRGGPRTARRRGRADVGVRIGILGRGGVVGPAAEELGAVYGREGVFAGGFEGLELGPV